MKGLLAVGASVLIAGTAAPLVAAQPAQQAMRGQGHGQGRYMQQPYRITDETALTQDEKNTLLRMIEEEKLAGDLYVKFYEKWGNSVFQKVARSEDKHEASVKKLLDAYGLTDPRLTAAGTYNDADLQALYDTLLEKGMQSESAALDVARQFEVDDINELQDAQERTDKANLDRVFSNLERASRKHEQHFTQ